MGTIAEKLTYLEGTKSAIKDAIIAKGVEVADTDTFRSYAEKIESIEAGGSCDDRVIGFDNYTPDEFLTIMTDTYSYNWTIYNNEFNGYNPIKPGKFIINPAYYGEMEAVVYNEETQSWEYEYDENGNQVYTYYLPDKIQEELKNNYVMCVGDSNGGNYASYEYDIRNIQKSEYYPNGETKYYLGYYKFGQYPNVNSRSFQFTKKEDVYLQENPYEYTHPITNNMYYITLEAEPNYDYLYTYSVPYSAYQWYNYKGIIIENSGYKNITWANYNGWGDEGVSADFAIFIDDTDYNKYTVNIYFNQAVGYFKIPYNADFDMTLDISKQNRISFEYWNKLKTLKELDCSHLTGDIRLDGFWRLTNVEGFKNYGQSGGNSISLYNSYLLTRESCINIFNSISTVSSGTININYVVYNLLTDDDKKIATDKGWNVYGSY